MLAMPGGYQWELYDDPANKTRGVLAKLFGELVALFPDRQWQHLPHVAAPSSSGRTAFSCAEEEVEAAPLPLHEAHGGCTVCAEGEEWATVVAALAFLLTEWVRLGEVARSACSVASKDTSEKIRTLEAISAALSAQMGAGGGSAGERIRAAQRAPPLIVQA